MNTWQEICEGAGLPYYGNVDYDAVIADADYDAIAELFNFDDEQAEALIMGYGYFDTATLVNVIVCGDYRLYEGVTTYEMLGEEIVFDQLHNGDAFLEYLSDFIDYEKLGWAYCTNHNCLFDNGNVLEVAIF